MQRSSLPEGYTHALCQPLTRRVLLFGLPYTVWVFALFAGLQIVGWRLWPLFGVLLPALWVLRLVYRHDPWGPSAWLTHVRDVLRGTTRLEV